MQKPASAAVVAGTMLSRAGFILPRAPGPCGCLRRAVKPLQPTTAPVDKGCSLGYRGLEKKNWLTRARV